LEDEFHAAQRSVKGGKGQGSSGKARRVAARNRNGQKSKRQRVLEMLRKTTRKLARSHSPTRRAFGSVSIPRSSRGLRSALGVCLVQVPPC
jgi:ribosomal protein L9